MVAFPLTFGVKDEGNERQRIFEVLIVYLHGIIGYFTKMWMLLYTFEITAICQQFNSKEIYTPFGVNYFNPKSWLCKVWDI